MCNEKVNQQLLAALKAIKYSMQQGRIIGNDYRREMKLSEELADTAIAAAEAAQPIVKQLKVPATTNRYGLDTPYFVRWLNRVVPSLENYTPAEFAREFGRMAAAADKDSLLADQHPASTQPVAVPDASLRARVDDLIHLLQFFGMDAVSDADKIQALSAIDDIRAMLSASSNP